MVTHSEEFFYYLLVAGSHLCVCELVFLESAGGTLKSQSTCDVVVSQSSHPSAGSLSVVGPFNSPLLRLANRLPFVCSYSIHPAQNQSVILTLVNTTTGHDTSTNPISEAHHEKHYDSTSSPQCRTVCSTSGCSCDLSKLTQIDQVDHFSIVTGSGGSTEIACFCGSLSVSLFVGSRITMMYCLLLVFAQACLISMCPCQK